MQEFDPWVGKILGEGNGNPLQYFCLENLMDRRAWWVTVYGVSRVGQDLVTKPSPCLMCQYLFSLCSNCSCIFLLFCLFYWEFLTPFHSHYYLISFISVLCACVFSEICTCHSLCSNTIIIPFQVKCENFTTAYFNFLFLCHRFSSKFKIYYTTYCYYFHID